MKSIFITMVLATVGVALADQYGDFNPGRGCHVCGIVISDLSTDNSGDVIKYVKVEDPAGSQSSVSATETEQTLVEASTGAVVDSAPVAAESAGASSSNYSASAGGATSHGVGESQQNNQY